MKAYSYAGNAAQEVSEIEMPADMVSKAEEYRGKLIDERFGIEPVVQVPAVRVDAGGVSLVRDDFGEGKGCKFFLSVCRFTEVIRT